MEKPTSEIMLCLPPIAKESMAWLGASALCVAAAIAEQHLTNREPTVLPRLAKISGAVGLLRASHAISEQFGNPNAEPSASINQLIATQTIKQHLGKAVGTRMLSLLD